MWLPQPILAMTHAEMRADARAKVAVVIAVLRSIGIHDDEANGSEILALLKQARESVDMADVVLKANMEAGWK